MSSLIKILALTLCAAGFSLPAAAEDGRCFLDWSEAAPVVRREGLIAVDRLSELVRAFRAGEIVKTTLCEQQGRFVYRLVVREPRGLIRVIIVDARRPFER